MLRRSDSGTWVAANHAPVADDTSSESAIEGERRLMTAVLVHALRSLFSDAERPGRVAARRLQQDMRWLTSPDRNDLFAFERICESLALDAERVRQHVLKQLGAATQAFEMSPSGARGLGRLTAEPFFFEPAVAVG